MRNGLYAVLFAAAEDAVMHGVPNVQYALADHVLRPPNLLIRQHELRYAQVVPFALNQHLVTGFKRVGQFRLVEDYPVFFRFFLVYYKTAANRVVFAAGNLITVFFKRGKPHAVGMVRQHLIFIENEIFAHIKSQLSGAGELELTSFGNIFQDSRYIIGMNLVRQVSCQSQHDRVIRSVTSAGMRQ